MSETQVIITGVLKLAVLCLCAFALWLDYKSPD